MRSVMRGMSSIGRPSAAVMPESPPPMTRAD
jgi:hypothetical protein